MSNHESPARRGNYPQAPLFKRSPLKYLAQPRETTEPIWEHLYNEGRKSKQELLEKQNKTKNKIDTECTFQPILKSSKRYLVHSSSNFLDRVNLWNEQKIERKVKEKEDKVCSDLKECTFTPKMYPRMRTATEYENKSPLKTEKSQKELRRTKRHNNQDCSPTKSIRKEVSRSPTPKQKRTSV